MDPEKGALMSLRRSAETPQSPTLPAPPVMLNKNNSTPKSPANFTNKPQKQQKTSKPIPMRKTPSNSAPMETQGNKNARKNTKREKEQRKNAYLMQPDDFSDEEFDFEANLQLFNKSTMRKTVDATSQISFVS